MGMYTLFKLDCKLKEDKPEEDNEYESMIAGLYRGKQ